MMQAAAGFCGGAWVGHRCSTCEFPHLRRASDETAAFRLSVRVLSAAIPALCSPGLLMRQRPRAEVTLGNAHKETEPAEFSTCESAASRAASGNNAGSSTKADEREPGEGRPSAGVECPWRFGDTLTFVAGLADVMGPGLKLRLTAHTDLRLGPLQVELARQKDLGGCIIDLRRRVLPACVHTRRCDPDGSGGVAGPDGSHTLWETPVLLLALTPSAPVSEGDISQGSSCAPAHVALTFGVSSNPEVLTKLAADAERPLAEKVVSPFVSPLKQLVHEPSLCSKTSASRHSEREARSTTHTQECKKLFRSDSFCAPLPGPPSSLRAAEAAAARATAARFGNGETNGDRGGSSDGPWQQVDSQLPTLRGPDQAPSGWVCCQALGGRVFWHHTSLGPPPWPAEATMEPTIDVGPEPVTSRTLTSDECSTQEYEATSCATSGRSQSVSEDSSSWWKTHVEKTNANPVGSIHDRYRLRPLSFA